MISSIFLSGRLGRVLDYRTRQVEVDSPIPDASGSFPTFLLPIRVNRGRASMFMTSPEGLFVTLKGRIEHDKKYGLLIVDELDEILDPPKSTRKVTQSHP